MKVLLLLAAVAGFCLANPFTYVTENDYIDVDAVFAHPPTLQRYLDCFLERGPCDSEAESYRRNIQDSVIRACDRCNLPQRERYAKFLQKLKTQLPHEYIAFRQKYDPFGIYFDALEAQLAKYLNYNTPLLFPYYYLIK